MDVEQQDIRDRRGQSRKASSTDATCRRNRTQGTTDQRSQTFARATIVLDDGNGREASSAISLSGPAAILPHLSRRDKSMVMRFQGRTRGICTETVVPIPGDDWIVSRPPSRSARPRMLAMP